MGLKKITMLSNEFYRRYDKVNFHQILRKESRPYSIFTIAINNCLFGIPFKTNLTHSKGYFIKKSGRNIQQNKPGLDYKKAIIILDSSFIDNENECVLDRKEAEFVRVNEKEIYESFKKYITSYKRFLRNPLDSYRIANNYINTSLIYFTEELGIILTEQLKIDILYSETLSRINRFLNKDGINVNFYYRRNGRELIIETKIGEFLFMLNENNLSDYCYKEAEGESYVRGPSYNAIKEIINNKL